MLGLQQQSLLGKGDQLEPRCGQDKRNTWVGWVPRNLGEQGKVRPILGPNPVRGIAYSGIFLKENVSTHRSLSVERDFRRNVFQIIKKLNFANKLIKSGWIQAYP